MAEETLSAGELEWLSYKYGELQEGDLFWFERRRHNNPVFRKISTNTALDISTQIQIEVKSSVKVYQKEY